MNKLSNLFPDADDLYERYQSLKNNDPYTKKRELFLQNYFRQPWKRTNKRDCNKKDPNQGQFKSKIDAAIGLFISVLAERNSWMKICPKYPNAGENTKPHSDKITSSFHKYFIRPWEGRFMMEIMASFDMVFWGKAIEHWPTPGCVYTENIPVEDVFPDTNASMDTKTWSYVFIRRKYTIAELWDMLEEKEEKEDDEGYEPMELEKFDKVYLREILELHHQNTESKDDSNTGKQAQGDYSSGSRDDLIPIVFAYVKDNFRKKNKVSVYAFPGEVKDYKKESFNTDNPIKVRTLINRKEYCKCLSEVIAVRAYAITRSYWHFNSFAQQIFLSTSLYDKAMALVIRAAKRNMILYFKSDNADTQKKLLKQNDDEVQVIPNDVNYVQTGQNTGVQELVEVVRQVMIENERGQSLAQAPGSQNVKGYAITAQEVQLNAQRSGEAESLNIKVLLNQDVWLYKEIYRRAIDLATSEEFKKSVKLFKEEMELYNVPKEYYEYDSVYFLPCGMNGGNQSSRIANSQMVLSALQKSPTSPGELQAQSDLVGAIVGVDNVEAYISNRLDVNPLIIKVGSENEDLDNPYVNPTNVPVLPDDKHLQEIPIHVGDYKNKLDIASGIIQKSLQIPNPVMKLILLQTASDLITAQDNKGAHIQAHVQAALSSKENEKAMAGIMDEFKKLQSMQDEFSNQIQQAIESTMQGMSESDLSNEKLRHLKAINQLTEEHTKTMNDIDLAKSIEKKQSMEEQRTLKAEEKAANAVETLAVKKANADIDINHKQSLAQIKQNEQANKQKSQEETP